MTLKLELSQDFLTVHLLIKFYHPVFNRSEVIVLTNIQIYTNKQTHKQVHVAENIHLAMLCYAKGERYQIVLW